MKKYILLYKPFLLFLACFFGSYVLLTLGYQLFLSGFDNNKIDLFTKWTAINVESVLSLYDSSAFVKESANGPFYLVYFKNQTIARIVEGCNGVSVIILFVCFVVAFTGSLRNTLLFILGGSVFIYCANVFRIVLLTVLLYYFPKQEHLLHGVFFPIIIYGLVFVLWVFWVNKFSKYAK